jgi:antitoxin component YwqK of YwqJK toxin-antitoxin module
MEMIMIESLVSQEMGWMEKWTVWYSNNQKKYEGVLKSNTERGLPVPDGKWISWFENGNKEREETYNNGKQIGLSTSWYENGQKENKGTYKDGERDGLWMWWLYDGNIDNEILYGMGNILYKTVYIYEYWDNGNKKFVGSEKSGERHGLWTWWYENGIKKIEIPFNVGKEDGILTF